MSGHIDQVHPQIMESMREHAKTAGDSMKTKEELDAIDRATDAEILAAFDRDYTGGAAGYIEDIGARP
jgi:hypothetical protein